VDSKKKQSLSVQSWTSASLLLIFIALVSRGSGFVRDILVAKYFGANQQVDAFMVALSLPMLILGGLGFALSTALVPIYRKTIVSSEAIQANKLAGSAVGLVSVMSISLALIILVIPHHFIDLIAPLLPESTRMLAVEFTRWLVLYVVGLNLVYILTAIYHSCHHFKVPAFSDLLFNITIILVMIGVSLPLGIYSLIYGHIIGIFLCVGVQFYFLFRRDLPGFGVNLEKSNLKSLLVYAAPILLFDFSLQVAIVIENYFASGLTEGSIAALNYAKRLNISIVALIAVNLSKGVFPTLSQLYLENKRDQTRDLFIKINKQLIFTFIPLSVFLFVFRTEIIKALFMRGAFDQEALELTSTAFLFYAAGLVIAAIEPVFLRACYAFSDSRTPLLSSYLSIPFVILITYILTPVMGLSGIALSTNIGFLIRLLIQAFFLQKKLGGFVFGILLKVGMTSLILSLISLVPIPEFSTNSLLNLVFSAMVFFILYLVLTWYFMNCEIRPLWKMLKQKIGVNPKVS